MSTNTFALKITTPYARALYDLTIDRRNLYQITRDFQGLQIFLEKTDELITLLENPLISLEVKKNVITKVLKSKVHKETFAFLMILVDRNRINLMQTAVTSYLNLIYSTAVIKLINISTSYPFTGRQRNKLVKKIRKLTDVKQIKLEFVLDPTLIGGFLLTTNSKMVDFTIKNQLQELAKHLDSVLEI